MSFQTGENIMAVVGDGGTAKSPQHRTTNHCASDPKWVQRQWQLMGAGEPLSIPDNNEGPPEGSGPK